MSTTRACRTRQALALATVLLVTGAGGGGRAIEASGQPLAGSFLETFDGAPAAPTPWNPSNWDVTVHSRDLGTYEVLEPMDAAHSSECGGPPATHPTSSYADAVFQCNDHVMTAITAEGYGVIYLTPAVTVDFSGGEAIVRVDVSTLRTSTRDWWDMWVTPFSDNVQLPLQEEWPDLNGHPLNGINLRLDGDMFVLSVYADGSETLFEPAFRPFDEVLVPDAARRDTFELRLSQAAISFGMPDYDLWWYEDQPVELDWTSGVVQFGHHSYNPTKDCEATSPCLPNTWHWDDVEITPAVPFTMIKATTRQVGGGETDYPVSFDGAAPAGAMLRFAGIGDDLEVSVDGGETWETATPQWQSREFADELFRSYWMPVAEGTTDVLFRGTDWWAGEWLVRDIAIWSEAVAGD